MAKVASGQFYFRQFGGYSGLRQVLEQDLVTIPDLSSGELTQPGVYTDVYVAEIQSHGHDFYSVLFHHAASGSFLHKEDLRRPPQGHWFHDLRAAGGAGASLPRLRLVSLQHTHSVGYLEDTYFLINPAGEVEGEFTSAAEMRKYCNLNQISIQRLKAILD